MRLLILGALVFVSVASAQNAFVVLEDDGPKLVKQVSFGHPEIEVHGQRQASSGIRYSLSKATLYRPGFITLASFDLHVSYAEAPSGGEVNYRLSVRGSAKSDTALKNCFCVIALKWQDDTGYAFSELPDLPANESVDFAFTLPMNIKPDRFSSIVHFFSDGMEVLHSRMSAKYVAKQREKTAAMLAGKQQDFPSIAAHDVTPAYPDELKSAKLTGSAVVEVSISKTGDVVSCKLVEATHPAFGKAALAAAAAWKFDPAIKARQLTASTFKLHFTFKPPE